MDIRGRCCPFQNKKEFLKCGAMLDTAFFHFENDYDIYKQLEATENSDYEKIIKAFLKKIGIKEWSWFKRFTYMFIDKYNEDNEITQDKDNIKELYKKLDDKHTKFFQEKHFNKFQFRCGRIIQGCFMNDYDYQTFAVSKVTKTYIEAYPIYYDGRCGDVRKFNKPSQFKRFVYNL